jgi:hypothetical protein
LKERLRIISSVTSHATTAIEAREKPVTIEMSERCSPERKARPASKAEVAMKKVPRRLERQTGQTLSEMLADFRPSAMGYKTSWTGTNEWPMAIFRYRAF